MNAVVEQIHSEFSEAEEILLQSVKKQLARAASTDKSRLNSLAALGFSNFKELREISPEEIQKAEALKETVERYRALSLNYKFITDDKITEICKKYGLIHGPIHLYTDSIPDQNQREILDFDKWIDSKGDEFKTTSIDNNHAVQWNGNSIREMDTDHILNTLSLVRKHYVSGAMSRDYAKVVELFTAFLNELVFRDLLSMEEIDAYDNGAGRMCLYYSSLNRYSPTHRFALSRNGSIETNFFNRSTDKYVKRDVKAIVSGLVQFRVLDDAVDNVKQGLKPSKEYTIIAAKHMMDLTDHDVNGDYKAIPKARNIEFDIPEPEPVRFFEDDDPIVLYKVENGYFIVSAWGPEASDENIVNHNMN